MVLQIQLRHEPVKLLRMAVMIPTSGLHESREKMFTHRLRDDGSLQPSSYLWSVIQFFDKVIQTIQTLPEVQIHLLNRTTETSNFNQIIAVVSSISDNFAQFDQFLMEYGHKIEELTEMGLSKIKHHLRQSDKGLSLHPKMFPASHFHTKGFELSTLELEYLIKYLLMETNPIQLPEIIGNHNMGYDIQGRSVSIPQPGHVIATSHSEIVSAFTTQGVILTRSPEKYRRIVDYQHTLGIDDSPIGINLIQLYTIQPGFLVDLISVLASLTGDMSLERSFLKVLDELFSILPREEFIGISIKNFFIDDDYNAYQTMSDQQSKYQLHQHLSKYLNHEIFNSTKMSRLDFPGLHLIDLSKISKEIALVVDIMFRLLHNYGYLNGMHISDVFGEYLLDPDFNVFKQVHLNVVSTPSMVVVPKFVPHLLQGSTWDVAIINLQQLRQVNLTQSQKNILAVEDLIPHIQNTEGYLLRSRYQGSTILHDFDAHPQTVELPIVDPIVFDYSQTEEEDAVVEIPFEEDDDLVDETYLSQYHIISILAAMAEPRRYSVAEIELNLWSNYQLGAYVQEMVERNYLHEEGKFYVVDSKGKTYLARITRVVREKATEHEYENAINFITEQITSVMSGSDPSANLTILYSLYNPLKYLVERIDSHALLFHYYGLVAETQYRIDHPDNPDLLQEHVKHFSTILDDKIAEEDLIDQVMLEMDEEDGNFEEAIDKVMDSEEMEQLIQDTIETEIEQETPVFEPAEYDDVGRWIPSTRFIEIIDTELEEEHTSIKPRDIFLLYAINYLEIDSHLALELYLDRLGLADRLDIVRGHPACSISNSKIQIDLDKVTIPLVPPSRSQIVEERIIPYLSGLLPELDTELVSQTVKQNIISILSSLGLQQYTFILHALMSGDDPFLEDCLEQLLLGIVDPEAAILPHLRHDLEMSHTYRQLHDMKPRPTKTPTGKTEKYPRVPVARTTTGDTGKVDTEISDKRVEQTSHKDTAQRMVKKALVSNLPRPSVKSKERKPSVDFLTSIKMEEERITTPLAEEPPEISTEESSSVVSEEIVEKEKEISVLGYSLPIKDEIPPADPEVKVHRPSLSTAQQAIYDRLSKEHSMIELSRIAPRSDLSYGTILTLVHKVAKVIDEGPERMLQEMITHIFAEYGIKMDTFPAEVIITNLTQISKRIEMDFSGFIRNYADIASNWKETQNSTILYYYLNRCITACNDFTWNEGIRNYLST